MQYVQEITSNTLEVKQSKFIAFLLPYSEFETTLHKLKTEHPKARHFVTAYRYLNEFNQIIEHSSDDGEPKGTSGKPTLFVLQGAQLINTAVITVRYFGGTKLGTGGLVRAYSDATNLVINKAELLEYEQEIIKYIEFEYTNIRMIEYECGEQGIRILEKSYDMKTLYKVSAAQEKMYLFLQNLQRVVKVKDL